MHELMGSFLKCRKSGRFDYAKKFEALVAEEQRDEHLNKTKTCAAEMVLENPEKDANVERKCPRCGASLILRTSRKGEKAGKQFWGCSAFPKCWYKEKTV